MHSGFNRTNFLKIRAVHVANLLSDSDQNSSAYNLIDGTTDTQGQDTTPPILVSLQVNGKDLMYHGAGYQSHTSTVNSK